VSTGQETSTDVTPVQQTRLVIALSLLNLVLVVAVLAIGSWSG
jgi:hypothetical protein